MLFDYRQIDWPLSTTLFCKSCRYSIDKHIARFIHFIKLINLLLELKPGHQKKREDVIGKKTSEKYSAHHGRYRSFIDILISVQTIQTAGVFYIETISPV